MTARKQKSNTTPSPVDSATRTCCGGIGDHTAECPPALRIFDTGDSEPVELDPPDPALARWEELVGRAEDINIYHDGDAAQVIGLPRPAWSDPDQDVITRAPGQCVYQTTPVRVALTLKDGFLADDETTIVPARLAIRGFMGHMASGDLRGVELRMILPGKGKSYTDEKPWLHTAVSLTISEARELADVLLAAVDVLGGAE